MIGIIVAMQIEFDSLVSKMSEYRLEKNNKRTYAIGKISDKDVVVGLCGVGKVAAGISTAQFIERYQPEAIINTGVAGGLKEYENVYDIVISKKLTYHDWDTTPIGDAASSLDCAQYLFTSDEQLVKKAEASLKKVSGHNVYIGDIVSGDQFIVKSNVSRILEQFPSAIASEMEATSIAHGCDEYNVPFVCIRSLSDITVKEASHIDFLEFVKKACDVSASFIEIFLKEY